MPVKDGAGYSELTDSKQEMFRRILIAHMSTSRAVMLKNPVRADQRYWYFDLYAGWGKHPDGSIGSPAIFIDVLDHHGIDCEAHLFEQHKKAVPLLTEFCSSEPRLTMHAADNRQFAALIPEPCDSLWRFGLLYIDPNGSPLLTRHMKPFVQSARWSRIDLLLHVPAGTMKRSHGAHSDKGHLPLDDYIEQLNKRYWIINNQGGSHGAQWTFLLGTNWEKLDDFRRLGFVRVDSPEGRMIINALSDPAYNATLPDLRRIPAPSLFSPRANSSHAPEQRVVRGVPEAAADRGPSLTLPGLGDIRHGR